MMWRLTTAGVVVLAGLALAAPRLKDPPKAAPAIVGDWVAEQVTVAGARQLVGTPARYVFAADGTLAVFAGDRRVSGSDQTYTADRAKSPPAVNLCWGGAKGGPGPVREGIYKVDGDTLTLCIAPMDGGRPKAFESTAEVPTVLFVFKRAKPKE